LKVKKINQTLRQAHDEVRFELLDEVRMRRAFNRINEQEIVVKELEKPTPLAFPLMVEMFRAKLTTEKLEERVKRLLKKVE
jgi:ATP-dependent helicase Lhr and Lhr-like helicase